MRDAHRDWESFGNVDPYYGVITREEYRYRNLTTDALEGFFGTGRRHVDSLFEAIRKRVDPRFSPRRALDFGCGVGRILIPLAERCEAVVGADVSPSMLELARRHCESRSVGNAELVLTRGGLEGIPGDFDFVNSYIVLQHVPRRKGEQLFEGLCGLLREGGVAALHLTFQRELPRWKLLINWMQKSVPLVQNLVNVARGRSWSYPHMEMNRYDLNRILHILLRLPADDVFVEFTDHGGHLGVYLVFRRSPPGRAAPPHLSFE